MIPARGPKPFLPLCQGYGARLTGEAPAEWRSSVTRMFDAVQREKGLLGPDLQALHSDATWLAAALGCRVRMHGPFEWVVEAGLPPGSPIADGDAVRAVLNDPLFRTQRDTLVALRERGTRVAATIPAPWTLARQLAHPRLLGGAEWEELLDASVLIVCNVARSVLDTGISDLIFWEDFGDGDASVIPEFYGTVYNVLAHFKARAWMALKGRQLAQARLFRHAVVSAVLFPDVGPDALLGQAVVEEITLGVGIPADLLTGRQDDLERRLAEVTKAFHASPAQILCPLIPHDAVPESVIRLVEALRRSRG